MKNVIICYRLESKMGDMPNTLVARFYTESEAEKAAPKAGGYGPYICEEIIVIYDKAIDAFPDLNEQAKQSGLAKLTKEEKEALGLSIK